jgi:hypothetical protein
MCWTKLSGEIAVGGEEKAAGAAGGVGDQLAGLGLDAVDEGLDEGRGVK